MIERRFCHTKQWQGLATRYDKHAIIYRAAALIHATIAWTRELATFAPACKPPANRERSHTQTTGLVCDTRRIRMPGLDSMADEERNS